MILSQRKAGHWKRDVEKTKGTDSIDDWFQPSAGPVMKYQTLIV